MSWFAESQVHPHPFTVIGGLDESAGGVGSGGGCAAAAFIGVGVGSAFSAGSLADPGADPIPHALFIYVHETEADAAANADALRTLLVEGASLNTSAPWRQRFGVAEIRVDGTAVVAQFTLAYGVPALTPYRVLVQQDNLVVHQ